MVAKCPKCGRKARRRCPALVGNICSRCCGELRLRELDCPADCVFLEGEGYQQKRRHERSMSVGRPLLEVTKHAAKSDADWRFLMTLQAEVFAFSQSDGSLDDDAIVRGLDGFKGLIGRIYVASTLPTRLAQHLEERADSREELSASAALPDERRVELVDSLISVVKKQARQREPYTDLLTSFFTQLDLERDLGVSIEDSRDTDTATPEAGFHRRASGLIVPPNG